MSTARIVLCLGLLAEFIGLALIFVEAGRVRRRELGEKTRLQKLADEIRFTVHNPATVRLAVGSAGEVRFDVGGADVRAIPDENLKDVVRFFLEQRQRDQARLDELLRGIREDLAEQVERLQTSIDEIKASQRTALIRAIRTERVGSALVLFGFALQAIVAITQTQ